MKRRLYYVLFPTYALVVAFVLYMNGVFTGETGSKVNLAININFLVIIGVLFLISAFGFARLGRLTGELAAFTARLQKEYKEANGRNLWGNYQNKNDVFEGEELSAAFHKYQLRIKSLWTRQGAASPCDLEEYINEDLLDRAGMNFFNSGISGTLTGLGILGTFLGLSLGLGAFSGDDIFTISDNVGALLSGMKVAFHTSVYGIFFSLLFNFIYRSIMSDAYEKLEEFLHTFRQTAQPRAVRDEDNSAAMVVYQAGISGIVKEILEIMKKGSAEQAKGVERIVDKFVDQMQETLGTSFRELGDVLWEAGKVQKTNAANTQEMIGAVTNLVEVNRNVQQALTKVMERQEIFADELKEQRGMLEKACNEMTDEIAGQLYAFDQMRNLYEK